VNRTERLILLYSPIWMAVVSTAIFSGRVGIWGESQLEALGIGLSLPVWALALEGPWGARYALLITLFSFVQNWFGTWLFFDVFGMQYHFHATRIWNGSPAFLYFLTIPYFATYYVVLSIAWRAIRKHFPSPAARWLSRALLSYAIAFAETASMATERTRACFSYANPAWVMKWGSIAYGIVFFVSLPLFYELDEKQPIRSLVRDALAANMVALIAYVAYGTVLRLFDL
jgi:hypothetical protein